MDDNLLQYFIEQTNDRLNRIDQKLEELLTFKWKIIGGSVILSLFLSLAVNLYFKA